MEEARESKRAGVSSPVARDIRVYRNLGHARLPQDDGLLLDCGTGGQNATILPRSRCRSRVQLKRTSFIAGPGR